MGLAGTARASSEVRRGAGAATAVLLVVGAVVPALPALAAPGDVTLASIGAGATATLPGNSFGPVLSADGTVVAFVSLSQFDPRDTDSYPDVYAKDLVSGALTLVATTAAGVKANGPSGQVSISADGTKVAFESGATNLGAGVGREWGRRYTYVKDLTTGQLTVVKGMPSGNQIEPAHRAEEPHLSADATRVAYISGDPFSRDVYVRDLTTGATTVRRLENRWSYDPMLSGDGTRVVFSTIDVTFGRHHHVYVADLSAGTVTLASANAASTPAATPWGATMSNWGAQISQDGTAVAFWSNATNLHPDDPTTDTDLYVKELSTGAVDLVPGPDGSGDASLSADASRVAFTTGARLDPADWGGIDVYVLDRRTGDLTYASSTPAGRKAWLHPYVHTGGVSPSLSGDGVHVAFSSPANNLDPRDTDGFDDVYVKELPPTDDTPPVITPQVDGVLGDGGWCLSDVTVAWDVVDLESPVTARSAGCEGTTLSDDTTGTELSCEATSAGGTGVGRVTVRRDATPPTVTFAGNQGTYGLVDEIAIDCVADDATSGVVHDTCEDLVTPAWTLPTVETTLEAEARDAAGNAATGSTSFTVLVTHDGLSELTRLLVGHRGIANALTAMLDASEAAAARGRTDAAVRTIDAYRSLVRAQSDRHIDPAVAEVLLRWSDVLRTQVGT